MLIRNSFLFTSLLLAGIFMTFSACKKDQDRVKEEIVGNWNVTSYMEDGEELMGEEYTEFTLTFNAYDGSTGTGTWSIVSSSEFGDFEFDFPLVYAISDDGEKIELMGETMDLEIVNNTMTMSGMVDLEDTGELSDVRITAQRQ